MKLDLLISHCKVTYGYPFNSSLFNPKEGMPIIRIRDIDNKQTEAFSTEKASDEYLIFQNDLLIGMDGNFNVALWQGSTSYLNQRVCKIESEEIDKYYLYYFLKRKMKEIEARTSGSTVKHLSAKEINRIQFEIKSKAEMVAISNELTKIDNALKLKQNELIALDGLIKSRFIEMFGDVLKNNKSFDTCQFGEYVNQINIGPFGSDLKNDSFVPKEKGYCMVYEQKHAIDKDMTVEARYVNEDKYNHLKRFDIGPGDIIVSCRGTIGECFILPDDAPHGIIHPSLMMIKPKNDVNHKFLVFLLERILDEQNEQGSGVKMAIKATDLAKIITIKPTLELQNNFIEFVEQIDKSKFIVQKSLEQLQLLFDSLMQKYFG